MRNNDSCEKRRLFQMAVLERNLLKQGYVHIAGVDEAGRGPLAGPVMAAACILPSHFSLKYLNDSKELTPSLRESLYEELIHTPNLFYGVGCVSAERIDKINILQATLEAMKIAIENLPCLPDYILIDGNRSPSVTYPHQTVIRGDALSISIAAASIIAKVTRDKYMNALSQKWPQYGFEKHKGYGTVMHLDRLKHFGPSPEHRLSFAPIADLVLPKV